MKILLTYRDYFSELPGGIERHVYQLAHGLKDRAEVDVLIPGPRNEVVEDEGVTLIRRRQVARVKGLPLAPGFRNPMRSREYDVIHLHSPDPAAEFSYFLSISRGWAAVFTHHADLDRGSSLGFAYRHLIRSVHKRASAVVTTSSIMADRSTYLGHLRKRDPLKLRVIPLGVDIERFTPSPHRTDRSDPRPTVLFVGRLRYYKGLGVLIDAISALDARLVVAGDGPIFKEVVALCEKKLGDRFVALGAVSERRLPEIFREADVFCLPSISRAEAFGLATLEAMASGLPVVTTEVGTATSHLNRHGETGLVVPPRSPEALSTAIRTLLEDPQLRERMGKNACATAESYSTDAMIDRHWDLYTEITRGEV